jgi:hypothetical protein
MNKITMIAALAATTALAACGQTPSPPDGKIAQSQKAAEAANSIKFTENSEIENITRRLNLTSNPGQIGFVLLMNESGQPVMYMSVKGKITSGGKRLTRTEQVACVPLVGDNGTISSECQYEKVAAPSDEGTYGSSGEYIYFWNTEGQYIQWNGKYLYSDKPFRTRIEPLVIATN